MEKGPKMIIMEAPILSGIRASSHSNNLPWPVETTVDPRIIFSIKGNLDLATEIWQMLASSVLKAGF